MTKPLELRPYAEWEPTNLIEADLFLSNARLHLLNRGATYEAIATITLARLRLFKVEPVAEVA